MFLSGVVKFASGDPNWRNLTALQYHFWTQPLPNPLSLAVAASPHWLLVGLCAVSLSLELVVPFFIFGPRPLRRFAFVALASLQVGIELTGNYGFFNLLTLVLCLPLLDEERAELARARPTPRARRGARARRGPPGPRQLHPLRAERSCRCSAPRRSPRPSTPTGCSR